MKVFDALITFTDGTSLEITAVAECDVLAGTPGWTRYITRHGRVFYVNAALTKFIEHGTLYEIEEPTHAAG